MTDQAIAVPRRTSAMERYLAAETRLWQHYGLLPGERFVEIARPRARLRVLEADRERQCCSSTAPSVRDRGRRWSRGMPGFRCLLLDRPGWGLSTPVDYPRGGYRQFVADLLAALLDSLDIDRVDVVGGSIGDVWALSLAEHHPDARRSGRAPRRRADRRRCPRAGRSSGCSPRRSARSSSGCRSIGIASCPSFATAAHGQPRGRARARRVRRVAARAANDTSVDASRA